MQIDRTIFYKLFKQKLLSGLSQDQVNGLNFLLNSFEKYDEYWKDVRQVAYALATVMHETASSFEPVEEGYYLGGQKAKNFQKNLRYYPWYGRGYVQLTWEENYKKANTNLRRYMPQLVSDFEKKYDKLDLTKNPSQALDPIISFAVMTLGMHFGWFRAGNDLDKYINSSKTDYLYARLIINGIPKGHKIPDKADVIASYAKQFEAILRIAKIEKPLYNDVADNFSNGDNDNYTEANEHNEDNYQDSTSVENSNNEGDNTANTTNNKTEVSVVDGDVKVKTGQSFVEEKIAIEKPVSSNFIETIRNKVLALGGGNLTFQGVKDQIQEIKSFHISESFWMWATGIIVASSIIYLITIFYKHKSDVKRDLEITNQLIQANTTPNNIVKLIDKENVDQYKTLGYKIITR